MYQKAFCIFLCVLAVFIFAFSPASASPPELSLPADTSAESSGSCAGPEQAVYTLRLYGDLIAVYRGDEAVPIRLINPPSGGLTQGDYARLSQGIQAQSREELALLLEDFES